jgi:TolB-like protein
LSETPAIAVLPFVNMSDDPEQEFFADASMPEDADKALRQSSWILVLPLLNAGRRTVMIIETRRLAFAAV